MPAAARADAPSIAHAVSCGDPARHHFRVESRFAGFDGDEIVLVLPVWTPGSYMVRDFSRHLFDVAAADARGRALPVRKIRKNAWRVRHGGRAFRVSFRAFAFEATVRTAYLDAERGWFNGANLLMYVEGRGSLGATVAVRAPEGWTVATSMRRVRPGRALFAAADYDELLDHPFLLGRLRETRFTAGGKPHRFVVSGEGAFPTRELVAATRKVVDAARRLFRGLPYARYAFFANLAAPGDGQGGLEHRDACLLQIPRFDASDRAKARSVVGLIAHEHFHAWNVKRIRDRALGPFDYERENYTELLWFHEGFTSYYDDLLPCRAGALSRDEFLEGLAEAVAAHRGTPGRSVQSLREASFDAWIKFYKRNEEARSVTVSYYSAGSLAAFALDALLRARTGDRRSLDDVMRRLWSDAKRGARPLTSETWLDAAEEATGVDLRAFAARYVDGTDELPLDAALAAFGLRAAPKDGAAGRAWIGAAVRSDGGRIVVEEALHGGPAFAAGLHPRDEIAAVDGLRAGGDLTAALARFRPGDTIAFDVFRGDRLLRLRMRAASDPSPALSIAARPRATPAEKRRFRAWCGRPHPGV